MLCHGSEQGCLVGRAPDKEAPKPGAPESPATRVPARPMATRGRIALEASRHPPRGPASRGRSPGPEGMWLSGEGTVPGPKGSGKQNHFRIPRMRGADPRASGRLGGQGGGRAWCQPRIRHLSRRC